MLPHLYFINIKGDINLIILQYIRGRNEFDPIPSGNYSTLKTTDLLQVPKALILSFHDGAHTTEGRAFQLLAAIERITKLEQSNVVLGHVIDEVSGSVDLTQGQLVVVPVIEHIHEIGVKGMDIVELRKFV